LSVLMTRAQLQYTIQHRATISLLFSRPSPQLRCCLLEGNIQSIQRQLNKTLNSTK